MNTNDKNEEDYLKDLAPNLFNEELEREKQLPDGYFEGLENRVLAKIKDGNSDLPKGRLRSPVNYRNLAIAAGFALLLALSPFLWNMINDGSTDIQSSEMDSLENLDENEVSLYLAEEYDVDEWLYTELKESEIERIKLPNEDISDEEIIDYLLESDLSEKMILESL